MKLDRVHVYHYIITNKSGIKGSVMNIGKALWRGGRGRRQRKDHTSTILLYFLGINQQTCFSVYRCAKENSAHSTEEQNLLAITNGMFHTMVAAWLWRILKLNCDL